MDLVNQRITTGTKPVVTCYLGSHGGVSSDTGNVTTTHNLDDAATAAIRLGGGIRVDEDSPVMPDTLERERTKLKASQKYIRGVFSGGTLCYQAQQVLRDSGFEVYSNEPLDKDMLLTDSDSSIEHTLVDMGSDEFTGGKPHPMVDSTQRVRRILLEAEDPEVGVILLDCVLGYVATEDTGGEIAPSISKAKLAASHRGAYLSVVASVCGTELDQQGLDSQIHALEEAGVVVFTSGFQAAKFAAGLVVERDQ